MKPAPLHPGARIGVLAPASAPREPALLERGLTTLRGLGYDVVTYRDDFSPHGYLAGPDEVRLAEFNHFLNRDDLHALFCVRGGYGTLRLLPHLDYAAARRRPKVLLGYSDITALHLALYEHAGWTGISGAMVAVEWPQPDAASAEQVWALLRGATPSPLMAPTGQPLVGLRPGSAEGVLLGGNLSLVARLVGTSYLPDLTGAILVLEEIGEPPYRVDGLFAQLKLSGLLDRLGGLVLGGFTEAEPPEGRPSLALDEVLAHYTDDLPFPVATGLLYGHFPVKSAIPIGVRARLEVTGRAATLSVLEPVVEAS